MPLVFVGTWYVIGAIVHGIGMQVLRRDEREDKIPVVVVDVRSVMPLYFWSLALLRAEWFIFAAAIALAPAVTVTIIFESWPVVFALLTFTRWWRNKMLEGEDLDRSAAISTLALMTVGVSGVALVILSEVQAISWTLLSLVGIILAIFATIATATGGIVSQVLGATHKGHDRNDGSTETAHISTSAEALGRGIIGCLILLIFLFWWLVGGSASVSWAGVIYATVTSLVHVIGNWFFQHANHMSRTVFRQRGARVNSLFYLVPAVAIVLLQWRADTEITRLDFLIIGVAGVVAVNMVVHLDPEGAHQRALAAGAHGYKALVLALWLCGAGIVLRDDWLPNSWVVWSVVEYWGMIGVLATVFTLMLSFRQSRLGDRRREMDRLTLHLYQRFEIMRESGDLSRWAALLAVGRLQRVDTANAPEVLRTEYLRLRRALLTVRALDSDLKSIENRRKALADVETLVNLRQQGRNFAELAALTMFAAVTVALTITARPDGNPAEFAGLAHDTASLVVAATFAFLGFDLIDKRREADAPLIRRVTSEAHGSHRQPSGWRLELVAYSDHGGDRVIASLLGLVMLVGAVAMLGVKWFG